jgi:hypothetical protein
MKVRLVYSVTFIVLLLCFFIIKVSEAADIDSEGYDENTEITLNGTVKEILFEKRGPVILIINYKNKTYHVTIAPKWYLYKNNIEFRNGMELEITGSKFLSKEGTFYISARKIKFTESEKIIELRDSHCKPMWRRMH